MTKAQIAWGMKKAGRSLSDIAWQLDLKNGAEVTNLLRTEFEENAQYITSDTRAMLLALEWERLEALIHANYESAMMGDDKSGKLLLDAMKLQIQLAQLGTPDSATDGTKVLVVGGAEVDYVEKLKKMADG